jgi:hypothetical protein
MLCCVPLVRIDVSEERSYSNKATIFVALMITTLRSPEMSVFTRATRLHIQEDGILHSHRRENLKSYTALTG